MKIKNNTIKVIAKYNPRKNFPYVSSSKRSESNLLSSFSKLYINQFIIRKPQYAILGVKELEISGYGISDFVCLYYRLNTISKNPRKRIIAFEIKINDWKKAIFQAYRYKYFSNQSIAILPQTFKVKPLHIKIFKSAKVGLWLYDKRMVKIKRIYTPRYAKPYSESIYERTLKKLSFKFEHHF